MGIAIMIIVVVLAVIAVAVVGLMEYDRRRLRATFGPEYDRIARESGNRWEVRRELTRRQRAHQALKLRALSAADRERYAAAWQRVQIGFVDDPRTALDDADQLVTELLDARGYPADDANERLALLSVGHARALDGYRAARLAGERVRTDGASVSTEDLREAVLRYRTLFQELLTPPDAAADARPDERRAPSAARPQQTADSEVGS
jgi:hypothetical protein